MTVEPEFLGLAHDANHVSTIRAGGKHPLQQAAVKLAEFREGRSSFKARDLVGLLLSHGARAWRSSQPQTVTRLRVRNTHGTAAVRMRIS